MVSFPGLSELFLLGFMALQFLIPLVLVVLLVAWLVRKKRRDEELIGQLVQVRQTLEIIRERLNR